MLGETPSLAVTIRLSSAKVTLQEKPCKVQVQNKQGQQVAC